MHAFSQRKGKSLTRDFVREVKSLHYGMVKKRSVQGPYSGTGPTKKKVLYCQSKCTKFYFFVCFMKCILGYFMLYLFDLCS